MGILKRIAGILGFVKDEGHEVKDEEDDDDNHNNNNNNNTDDQSRNHRFHTQETGPRRGFSVPVQVVVDRTQQGPVLVPSNSGEGGVQGLGWYAKRLRIDEDGDVADEFLDEVLPEITSSTEDHHRSLPRFEVKYSTRRAKVKNQVMSLNGKIQQCVEYQGRLQLV